jgi:LytS/YehU family sensor histidine kinase
VFRYALESTRLDRVPLDDELKFLEAYLAIEKARFTSRLSYSFDVDPAVRKTSIPPMLLQPLVENAVRHGAANRVAPTEIIVAATPGDSNLKLSVWNTSDTLPIRRDEASVGTGLSRLRERLAFLYGEKARLTCGARDGGGFEAALVIPRSRQA